MTCARSSATSEHRLPKALCSKGSAAAQRFARLFDVVELRRRAFASSSCPSLPPDPNEHKGPGTVAGSVHPLKGRLDHIVTKPMMKGSRLKSIYITDGFSRCPHRNSLWIERVFRFRDKLKQRPEGGKHPELRSVVPVSHDFAHELAWGPNTLKRIYNRESVARKSRTSVRQQRKIRKFELGTEPELRLVRFKVRSRSRGEEGGGVEGTSMTMFWVREPEGGVPDETKAVRPINVSASKI
jgi:hypothetical protein